MVVGIDPKPRREDAQIPLVRCKGLDLAPVVSDVCDFRLFPVGDAFEHRFNKLSQTAVRGIGFQTGVAVPNDESQERVGVVIAILRPVASTNKILEVCPKAAVVPYGLRRRDTPRADSSTDTLWRVSS